MADSFGDSDELKKLISGESKSDEGAVDSLIWKWDKVLYRYSRITELLAGLRHAEASYNEGSDKGVFSKIGGRYEIILESKYDKNLIFEFEAFLDEIIGTIDAIPPVLSSKFPYAKIKSFHSFRKSLLQKYPQDAITLKVDKQWGTWLKGLKDFRDDETHHSLYYHRHKIRIMDGFLDFIPPAITIESIKTQDEEKIESHISEFECKYNSDDRGNYQERSEIFWKLFDEYFNTIEDFSKRTMERTWSLFHIVLH